MPDADAGLSPDNAQGGGQQPESGKVFTQAELEAQLKERIRRERNKYADYDDLKAKAAQYDQLQQAQLSELERAQKERDEANAKAADALKKASETLLAAKFENAAIRAGVKNADDAYFLASKHGTAFDADDPASIETAVRALIDEGRLVVTGRPGAPALDGGAGGGTRPERTVQLSDEQRKLAKAAGMTDQQYIAYLTAGPGEDMTAYIDSALKPKS